MEITAAVLRDGDGPYSIEQIELDGPREDEVLVRITAVGMCHSDALLRSKTFPGKLPVIPGHEGAGVVEAVGAEVTSIQPGDHVVLTFDSCGQCRNCTDQRPALCAASLGRNLMGWRADGSTSAVAADSSPVGSRDQYRLHYPPRQRRLLGFVDRGEGELFDELLDGQASGTPQADEPGDELLGR